jgi:hypothetical protein
MRTSMIPRFGAIKVEMTDTDQPRLRRGWEREYWRVLAALLPGWLAAFWSVSSFAQMNAAAAPASKVALVTFFSNPPDMMGSLTGHKSEPFTGNLFVGGDGLAKLEAGRFVTISFVPGMYEFTAATWMANGPAGGSHLNLDLAAHHHYYVELRDRATFPVTKMFGIKEVACEEAASRNAKDKPVDGSAVMAAGKDNLIAESGFPKCPETD